MSQWAIDGEGRSGDIFSSMKNAVLRRVKLNLLFNNHEDSDRSSGYSPFDLKKKAKWHDQVRHGKTILLTFSSLIFFIGSMFGSLVFGVYIHKKIASCLISFEETWKNEHFCKNK